MGILVKQWLVTLYCPISIQQCNLCLLYTSDAADD